MKRRDARRYIKSCVALYTCIDTYIRREKKRGEAEIDIEGRCVKSRGAQLLRELHRIPLHRTTFDTKNPISRDHSYIFEKFSSFKSTSPRALNQVRNQTTTTSFFREKGKKGLCTQRHIPSGVECPAAGAAAESCSRRRCCCCSTSEIIDRPRRAHRVYTDARVYIRRRAPVRVHVELSRTLQPLLVLHK